MDSTTNHILLQITMPRRLLLNSSPPPAAAASPDSKFDANVVMVLSVLLCALICSLGLNSIIRCALRCSHLVPSGDGAVSGAAATARLANTGIKKKALKTFPVITFSAAAGGGLNLDAECVICLSEFAAGDKVKILPKCNHGFHVRCIDKWLGSHSSCPTCRHCLIAATASSRPAGRLLAVKLSRRRRWRRWRMSSLLVCRRWKRKVRSGNKE
ncbi:RING-H2 finger protein ATL78 [Linum grandiflorum]